MTSSAMKLCSSPTTSPPSTSSMSTTTNEQYEPFEGICFADTLELAEGQQLSLFVEENTERVQTGKGSRYYGGDWQSSI